MEIFTPCIKSEVPLFLSPKTTLMSTHKLISRCIILTFMVMVGYSIAKSLQAGSTIGLILAVLSLSLGVYFIYLLKLARDKQGTT
jgi:hypothetical protein